MVLFLSVVNGMLMSFSKDVPSYFIWKIYCEGILIGEVVSVEKSWVYLMDEYLHGEGVFRMLVVVVNCFCVWENTLGEKLWSWCLDYTIMTKNWCLIGEV